MELQEDRAAAARLGTGTPAPLVQTLGSDPETPEGCFWDAEGRSDALPKSGETLRELFGTLESLLETREARLETR